MLTSRLIRFEWQPDGHFVDAATQTVVNRTFPEVPYDVTYDDTKIRIVTEHLEITYDGRAFSAAGLQVRLRNLAGVAHGSLWRFGDEQPVDRLFGNLGGTARTLDGIDGAIPLEPGILGRHGYAVLDDSSTLILDERQWPHPRNDQGIDLYFFGYALEFQDALRDFFTLTGPSPLIARAALGNWWSRYWRYSQEEYLGLLEDFDRKNVPLSVAVIDMDWHLVDIDPKLGTGWTGYTWNRELFPDPERFLAELHERGLAVSLNVHPADGVRPHEESYETFRKHMGLNDGENIAFDIADPLFVEGYFASVHHPLEDEGVDFWWLDWQQGDESRIKGLDPLWMLNHLHYEDSRRRGRPLIFSRYAGAGSHRYPIGFSGDTVTTWDSLDFQPYFTATAANIGYFWWSHDIGGHMFGERNHEMATRWLQFGVFSPINRLHSSNSPFAAKMPWVFPQPYEEIQERFMRLRHRMVPYLYTAMWRSHREGIAPVAPMYQRYPHETQAYDVVNQYLFGDLIVAPMTRPVEDRTHLSTSDAYLPDGTWYDIFTGQRYRGGRRVALYRGLETIPVLAPSGAILPLATDPHQGTHAHPESLTLRLFPGVGEYTLIEDDGGETPVVSEMCVSWAWEDGTDRARLEISGLEGRNLRVEIVGAHSGVLVSQSGREIVGCEAKDEILSTALQFDWGRVTKNEEFLFSGLRLTDVSLAELIFPILERAELDMSSKDAAWAAIQRLDGVALLSHLESLNLNRTMLGAITEKAANS